MCIRDRDCINEFYYASNRNILVALTTTTGHLIFRLQAVKKILECNDDITVKKCFLNIFTCYLKVLKMFTEMNIRTIQENVSGILEQGVWNELVNGDNLSRRFRNVFSDEPEEAIDRLKRNISVYINSTLENAFRDRIFGVSDQYSYARILNQIVEDNAYKEKQKFGDGFKKGVRFGLKFEMLGWEPCNPNFSDDNRDVNISVSYTHLTVNAMSLAQKLLLKHHLSMSQVLAIGDENQNESDLIDVKEEESVSFKANAVPKWMMNIIIAVNKITQTKALIRRLARDKKSLCELKIIFIDVYKRQVLTDDNVPLKMELKSTRQNQYYKCEYLDEPHNLSLIHI